MSDDSEVVDARCRLQAGALQGRRDEISEAVVEAGVSGVVLPDRAGRNRGRAARLAKRSGVWAAAGIGPELAGRLDDRQRRSALEQLEADLEEGAWCAVGAVGLDHRVAATHRERRRQREVLVDQLAMARRAGLPVLIRAVDSYNSLLRVIRDEGRRAEGGIICNFDGSPRQVGPLLMLGLDISMGPALLGTEADRVGEALRQAPSDRLHVETGFPATEAEEGADDPELEYRGPGAVIEAVANLRRCSSAKVAEWVGTNTRRVLDLGDERLED